MHKNVLPLPRPESLVPDVIFYLEKRFKENNEITVFDLKAITTHYERDFNKAVEVEEEIEKEPCGLCDKDWISKLECKYKVYKPLLEFCRQYRTLEELIRIQVQEKACYAKVAHYHSIKGDRKALADWLKKQDEDVFTPFDSWYIKLVERYFVYGEQGRVIGLVPFTGRPDLILSVKHFSSIVAYSRIIGEYFKYERTERPD